MIEHCPAERGGGMQIRRSAMLVAVALSWVVGLAIAPGGVAASPPGQSQADPAVLGQLRDILTSEAFVTGDGDPANMRVVATTVAAAMRLLSPRNASNSIPGTQPGEPVYFVSASGHFLYRDGLARPRSRAQRGTTLYILMSQSNEAVVVWGVARRAFDLRTLGAVQALDVAPTPPTQVLTAPLLAQLQSILFAHIEGGGDPAPTVMQAVATSSFAAETYLTSGWSPTEPPTLVFAVCAKGIVGPSFPISVPPGSHRTGPPPTVICLVVDPQTMFASGVALGSHYPDLYRLGVVQNLASGTAPAAAPYASTHTGRPPRSSGPIPWRATASA
jgi:hypothetical protein